MLFHHSTPAVNCHCRVKPRLIYLKCKLLHFPILRPGISMTWRELPQFALLITRFSERVSQTSPRVKWPFCARLLSPAAVDCLDPTCSNHGVCVNGECLCSPGWGGMSCELPRAQCPEQCSGHGSYVADTGLCTCDPNWMGPDCSVGKKNRLSSFCNHLFCLNVTTYMARLRCSNNCESCLCYTIGLV